MTNIKKILLASFLLLLLVFLFLFLKDDFFSKNNEEEDLLNGNKEIINEQDSNSSSELREIGDEDMIIGELTAKVQIIIYEDLSDVYSLKLNETIKSILANFSESEVVISFRPYINKSFPMSKVIYSLVECSKEQGAFFEIRELILEKLAQNNLFEENFLDYGKEIGLDSEKLSQCLVDEKHFAKIEKVIAEEESFDIYGSPTIFVNKEVITGARSFENVINGGGEELMGMKNIIFAHLNSDTKTADNVPVVCTMDAKECPDGSFVGRDGNSDCEFFPCP
ncbi:MAG: thioredoxin domain-containing protein [Patescibacteria group bacterium]|jgi:protein-disulfide isomerase